MAGEQQVALKSEIMLQVNEHLYMKRLISREIYEQAKLEIVKRGGRDLHQMSQESIA